MWDECANQDQGRVNNRIASIEGMTCASLRFAGRTGAEGCARRNGSGGEPGNGKQQQSRGVGRWTAPAWSTRVETMGYSVPAQSVPAAPTRHDLAIEA